MSTDGAKRDRLAWPGDLSVALPAVLVSTNDLVSVQNSIDSIYALQNMTTGKLPYVALPPGSVASGLSSALSFTYHCYSLIGVHDFYLYNVSSSPIEGIRETNTSSRVTWNIYQANGSNINSESISLLHSSIPAVWQTSPQQPTGSASAWAAITSKQIQFSITP